MSETLKNPLAEVNFHIIAWSTPPFPNIFFFSNVFIICLNNEHGLHESTCTISMEIKKNYLYEEKKNCVVF